MSFKINDELLLSVEKPSRYTGNEWNSVNKELDGINIRFAFCFPDVYEIGMSHLGMKILYHLLNERKDTYCERVFAPWTDMEALMRKNPEYRVIENPLNKKNNILYYRNPPSAVHYAQTQIMRGFFGTQTSHPADSKLTLTFMQSTPDTLQIGVPIQELLDAT